MSVVPAVLQLSLLFNFSNPLPPTAPSPCLHTCDFSSPFYTAAHFQASSTLSFFKRFSSSALFLPLISVFFDNFLQTVKNKY